MDRRRIEAIAEAIAKYSGYLNPDSDVYAARNPGALRAFSINHQKDESGNRIFKSFLDGWQALVYDLELKMSGQSRAHLRPDNNLVDLAGAYGHPYATALTTAQAWAKFLRQALRDEAVSHKTTLSYFIKD